MRRVVLGSVLVWAIVAGAGAQEFGGGPLSLREGTDEPAGRVPLPAGIHHDTVPPGTYGLTLAVGWCDVSWDVGPASGSETLFVPVASFFYMVTDTLDFNASLLVASAEDRDNPYTSSADMTRLAIGTRYWVRDVMERITPYVGVGLGYYLLDATMDVAVEREPDPSVQNGSRPSPTTSISSADDAFGAFAEGGVAFRLGDRVEVLLGVSYDFLWGAAEAAGMDAAGNPSSEDFDPTALSFNVGAIVTF